MRLFRRRRAIATMSRRGDAEGLARVLAERDVVIDAQGHAADLAVTRRLDAVRGLGAISGPEAGGALATALGDPDTRVRAAALQALIERDDQRAAQDVAQAVPLWAEPELEEARQSALAFLAAREDPGLGVLYAEALLEAEGRGRPGEREAAGLRAIFSQPSGNGTAAALAPRVIARLRAGDERERDRAAAVVRSLGRGAVDALVQALDDEATRRDAAEALGVLRDTAAVPSLLRLLETESAEARVVAARALGAIRDPQAVEGLMVATADDDPDVRIAAQDAIDALGNVAVMVGIASFMRPVLQRLEELEALQRERPRELAAPGRPGGRPLLRRLLGR